MKKIRLFFHGVIFLAVLSGLFSVRTVSGHASMKGVSHFQVVHQIPAGSSRPNLRFDCLAAADGQSSFIDSRWSGGP
jgi:hypothetical protein